MILSTRSHALLFLFFSSFPHTPTSSRLHNNQLSGTIPPEIFNCVALKWLYVADTRISGTIPKEIGKCDQLENLYVCASALYLARTPHAV